MHNSFLSFSSESFNDIGAYMKIGIPTTLVQILEWGSFEILALLAGYISITAIGAHVIIVNIETFLLMISNGSQIAATVTVGQAIG